MKLTASNLFCALSLFAVAAPLSNASAQQTSSASSFVLAYVVGNDTLGTEAVTIDQNSWSGDLRLKGQPRIRWSQSPATGSGPASLKVEVWSPGANPNSSPAQSLLLRTSADTAYVHTAPANSQQPGAPQASLPTRQGTLWLINQSLAHSALIASQRNAGDTVWLVMSSGAQILPGVISVNNGTKQLTIAGLVSTYEYNSNAQLIRVSVPAQRLTASRVNPENVPEHQTLEPLSVYDPEPGAPYAAHHIDIPTPEGHQLAATLTLPLSAQSPVPVAITISGSGGQDRDEKIVGIEGYRPFRQIADTLGRNGIAVLRFDDRGIGRSGGNHSQSNSSDFANDVRAIVQWLKKRPDIDSQKIFLIGHSEGGIIAPMIASSDSSLAGIVILSGPSWNGKRIIHWQQDQAIQQQFAGASQIVRDSITRVSREQLEQLANSDAWTKEFLSYEPLEKAAKVSIPVLILHGDKDKQITPEQARELENSIRKGGNKNVSMHLLANTNHLFQHDTSGDPRLYGKLEQRNVTTETLGLVTDWIKDTISSNR